MKIVLGILLSIHSCTAAPKMPYGIFSAQGRRCSMEDAHKVQIPFTQIEPKTYYFALFDGHGGDSIAQYCSQALHLYIEKEYNESKNIKDALIKGIEATDKSLTTPLLFNKAQTSGTTAIVAIIKENKLYVANVGDSRVILCRNKKAMPLTVDHKPDHPVERDRIEKMGGAIYTFGVPRIGGLALSRAIGDLSLRSLGVISEPEITITELTPEDEYILLACDGIFEPGINNQQAIDIINHNFELHASAQDAATSLVSAAYHAGSGDNMSVIIVNLNQLQK